MPESLEDRFHSIQEIIVRFPPAVRSDAMRLSAELSALRRQFEEELNTLRDQHRQVLVNTQEYAREVENLQKQFEQLAAPPLLHATLVGPSARGENAFVVSIAGSRYDVVVSPAEEMLIKCAPQDLTPGREVLVTKDTHVIVGLVGEGRRGEAAEVKDVLKDAATPLLDRLLVRAGSTNVVVEQSDGLLRLPEKTDDPQTPTRPKVGDTVLVDLTAKMAFEKLPSHETGALELEEDPKARYEDIAGLGEQIVRIRDAIELPYLHRDRFEAYGLERPHGILLYGPPGCGKTMIGAAVANGLRERIVSQINSWIAALQQCIDQPADQVKRDELRKSLPPDLSVDWNHVQDGLNRLLQARDNVHSYFLNVKGPELLSKWVGEAEQKVRQIFSEAKQNASYTRPVIVFFDEIESMFQRRGTGVSSDMEKTMVPQLLTELDGIEQLKNVVLIGASNRPELLDPALLRPGRLDIKIKIERPDKEATRSIFGVYLGPPRSDRPKVPLSADGLAVLGLPAFAAELSESLRCIREDGHLLTSTDGRHDLIPLSRALSDTFLPEVVREVWACMAKRREVDPASRRVLYGDIARAIENVWCRRQNRDGALTLDARVVVSMETIEKVSGKLRLPNYPLSLPMLNEGIAQSHERLRSYLIELAVDTLFSPHSFLRSRVLAPCAREQVFPLREFVSGALIANVVTRAKRAALKRETEHSDASSQGVSADDLLASIRQEYEENKDQFIANKPELGEAICEICKRRHNSVEDYEIEVILGRGSGNRWRQLRTAPYEQARISQQVQT